MAKKSLRDHNKHILLCMETTKQTYSEEDRNMGLISKATRSDTMIVNQLTKSEMITNALDECRN